MSVTDARSAGRRMRSALAASALVLGAGAALAGGSAGSPPVSTMRPDPGQGHGNAGRIQPLDLARRIRDREPGLVILDARGEGFDPALAVPGARPVEPGQAESWPLIDAASVVLYDLDEDASLRAAGEAHAAGRADAVHLEGGLAGWVSGVLEPVLPPPVTAIDSAANERAAELSRYFGGRPRVGTDTIPATADERVRRARRRGCGPG